MLKKVIDQEGPAQSPIQWVPGYFIGRKAAGA